MLQEKAEGEELPDAAAAEEVQAGVHGVAGVSLRLNQGSLVSCVEASQKHVIRSTGKRRWQEPMPDKLDRLKYFTAIRDAIPDLILDILKKNPDDMAFQDLIDAATIRNLPGAFVVGTPFSFNEKETRYLKISL